MMISAEMFDEAESHIYVILTWDQIYEEFLSQDN